MALSALSLPFSECFILRQGAACHDILPYLKFFNWVGCQLGFHHTRSTFVANFHILSRARLKPLLLDFLDAFRRRLFHHRVRFHDILPHNALHAFARMHFLDLDLDLDAFAYPVLGRLGISSNTLRAWPTIASLAQAEISVVHL
ncbi:hypothetical protein Fmac_002081 [Flemingia macrophylla]|uniref:Uncharacterized protein n=1 Tax=Flemingia macrophylla TaxID=520843 RepID=A0ABD1NJ18_9FABA